MRMGEAYQLVKLCTNLISIVDESEQQDQRDSATQSQRRMRRNEG